MVSCRACDCVSRVISEPALAGDIHDGSDPENTGLLIDIASAEDAFRESPDIQRLPDADSETVTFAWRRNEGEATTAWITVDTDVLVDGSDRQ